MSKKNELLKAIFYILLGALVSYTSIAFSQLTLDPSSKNYLIPLFLLLLEVSWPFMLAIVVGINTYFLWFFQTRLRKAWEAKYERLVGFTGPLIVLAVYSGLIFLFTQSWVSVLFAAGISLFSSIILLAIEQRVKRQSEQDKGKNSV